MTRMNFPCGNPLVWASSSNQSVIVSMLRSDVDLVDWRATSGELQWRSSSGSAYFVKATYYDQLLGTID